MLENLWLVEYSWRSAGGYFLVEAKSEAAAKKIALTAFNEITGYGLKRIFGDEPVAHISSLSAAKIYC